MIPDQEEATEAQASHILNQSREPIPWPEMHSLAVSTALDGAKVCPSSSPAPSLPPPPYFFLLSRVVRIPTTLFFLVAFPAKASCESLLASRVVRILAMRSKLQPKSQCKRIRRCFAGPLSEIFLLFVVFNANGPFLPLLCPFDVIFLACGTICRPWPNLEAPLSGR